MDHKGQWYHQESSVCYPARVQAQSHSCPSHRFRVILVRKAPQTSLTSMGNFEMLSGWVRSERQPPMSDLRPRRALRTAMHPLGCQIIQAWWEEGWISAKLIHISSRQAISTITISVIWGLCMVLVEWRNTNIYAGAFKHKHHLSSSHLPPPAHSSVFTAPDFRTLRCH